MSEYEEREAAAYAHVPWPEWAELDRAERVGIVAHFRLHSLVEAHRSDAIGADIKRRSGEASRGRRARRGTFDDTFRGGRPNG